MKPAPFRYHRARTLDEALALLARYGDDAKIIAGGQSLVPMMNMRLAQPEVLIDVGRIAELRGIDEDESGLHIGAGTRHLELERYEPDAVGLGIMREAARWIGHIVIRTRGTIGGSLAHADPTAEWCLLAVHSGAMIEVTSSSGRRSIDADEFLLGFLATTLEDGEIVTRIDVPRMPRRTVFREYARRHGDFAIVALAVSVEMHDGAVTEARLTAAGLDDRPVRLAGAERVLVGQAPSDQTIVAAAEAAIDGLPPAVGADGDYRRALAKNLVVDACSAAMRDEESP